MPMMQVVDISGLTEHRLQEISCFFADSEWFGEDNPEKLKGSYEGQHAAKHYVEQSCKWVPACACLPQDYGSKR
jgi:hypothetical protein